MSASTTPRFAIGANNDNTGRTITQDYQTPAYATVINTVTNSQITYVQPAVLTGPVTVNVDVTTPMIGDTLEYVFHNDGTSRTVTFGTGVAVSAATLVTVAGKFGSINFRYYGSLWIETARSLTA